MKRTIISIIFFCLLLSVISCDVNDGPYFEDPDLDEEEITVENPQKVLIIDFTGHTCKYCPRAHRAVNEIKQLYGNQVVSVAFHLGYFANPYNGDKFSMDFRTNEGYVLETYYEFVSFPVGVVNNLDRESLTQYSNWAGKTGPYIGKQSDIAITAETLYDETTGIANVDIVLTDVSAEGVYSKTGSLKLVIYLLESNIISWQKDEDSQHLDVENYRHNNVFRDAVGLIWGEDVSLVNAGDDGVQLNRSIEIIPSWVPDNCSFVIFVYEPITMEIVQVEQFKLN